MVAPGPDTAIPLQQAKLWLMDHTLLARDALHIYVALILFFGTMLLFRRRLGDWRPWLVVLAAALIGEIWDIIDSILYEQAINWSGSWKDLWNTMFWPTAILLLARHSRIFHPRNDTAGTGS